MLKPTYSHHNTSKKMVAPRILDDPSFNHLYFWNKVHWVPARCGCTECCCWKNSGPNRDVLIYNNYNRNHFHSITNTIPRFVHKHRKEFPIKNEQNIIIIYIVFHILFYKLHFILNKLTINKTIQLQ